MNMKMKFWSWGICPLLLRIFPLYIYCSSVVSVAMSKSAPDSISIPILKKIMDGSSSEKLKELVKSHPALNQNPREFQNIMNKLNPESGRLNPVMQDMLEAFERTHRDTTAVLQSSTERFQYPDDTASNRVASSTEENGIIWNDAISRPQRRDRDFNRFSSRYRSNKHNHTNGDLFAEYANYEHEQKGHYEPEKNYTQGHANNTSGGQVPFTHVTDPNLRNHRLYAWEFETYKNFTHIDQAEDLMADEDIATETKISPVAVVPPPPSSPPNNQLQQNSHIPSHLLPVNKTELGKNDANAHLWQPKPTSTKSKRVKVKGIPHIVISLEDTSDANNFPGYNFQMDSAENSGQRPREPLRQSSTENVVYVHGASGEEPTRYPYDLDDGDTDHYSRRFPGMNRLGYRTNPSEPSDALFIDPEQEFFTSTVRADQELSSETMPKRRRKKLKKVKKEEILKDHSTGSPNRFSNRMGGAYMDEDESFPGVQYSPVYSKNSMQGSVNPERARSQFSSGSNVYQTPGPHFPMMRPTPKYFGMGDMYKQDRILNAGDGTTASDSGTGTGNGGDEAASPSNFETFDAAQLSHLSDGGHIGNYYSLHGHPNRDSGPEIGLHSNLGGTGVDHSLGSKHNPFSQHEVSSQEHNAGHKSRLQSVIGALLPFQASKKLSASPTDQIIAPGNVDDFYHPYAEADHQVNHIPDESTIAVSWSNTWYIVGALIALSALMVLLLPTLIAPGRMGKKDTRHDLDEDEFNSSNYQGSSSNNHNNYHFDNTNNDMNHNSDLWTEVKGVYNDLVNLFRGEYSLLNKMNNKKPDGPKIVYRDEEGDEDEEDSDEEEDDEKEKVNLRNRKRNEYLKKQRQMLKKQQQQQKKITKQQQQQKQQTANLNQPKSNLTAAKKALVSTSKMTTSAARDNKDVSSAKTIEASSVNNLVVVSGPGPSIPEARMATAEKEPPKEEQRQEHSSPRAVTGFVIPENTTMATMPFINTTGYGNAYGYGAIGPDGLSPFLREWAQVQLINNHNNNH